jgi:translation initiation factor 2B subunit (eIF-2B alpha/beta/delta family)
MGLEKELKTAADVLKVLSLPTPSSNPFKYTMKETIKNAPFSLASGCELFTRFVTKTSLDIPDFETCKKKLIDRGDQFAQKSQASRAKVNYNQKTNIRSNKFTIRLHSLLIGSYETEQLF